MASGSRQRNIRRKDQEDLGDEQPAVAVHQRFRQTGPKGASFSTVRERIEDIPLGDIQDRSIDVPIVIDEGLEDDDYELSKTIEAAKANREAKRQDQVLADELAFMQVHQDDFVPLMGRKEERPRDDSSGSDHDEVGPLERVADFNLDEEVFEDLRGNRIAFGKVIDAEKPSQDLMDEEDEEMRAWEAAQISKGMASAGQKAPKPVRKAVSAIQEAHRRAAPQPFLDFESLDFYSAALERDLAAANAELVSYQMRIDQLQSLPPVAQPAQSIVAIEEERQFVLEMMRLFADLSTAMDSGSATRPELQDSSLFLACLARWKECYKASYDLCSIDAGIPGFLEFFIQPQLDTWQVFFPGGPLTSDLITQLDTNAFLTSSLREQLASRYYLPHFGTVLASAYKANSNDFTLRLCQHIQDLASILGPQHKGLLSLFWVLEDLFDEARAAQSNGDGALDTNWAFVEDLKKSLATIEHQKE